MTDEFKMATVIRHQGEVIWYQVASWLLMC